MTDNPANSAPAFLIDRILPVRDLHLICGPSADDNTLFTLWLLQEWRQSHAVLEMASYPCPYVYVACDRPGASLRRLMRGVGVDPGQIPHVSLIGKRSKDLEEATLDHAILEARKTTVCPGLIVLDGLASLCPGNHNSYRDVSKFIRLILETCRQDGVTVIGCLTSSKARPGEDYISPKDRIAGSTAWRDSSGTKMLFEPVKVRDVKDRSRKLIIMPNGMVPEVWNFTITEEGLVQGLAGEENNPLQGALDVWLQGLEEGTEFHISIALQAAVDAGAGKSTLYTWLDSRVQLGYLEKIKNGYYRKPKPLPVQ